MGQTGVALWNFEFIEQVFLPYDASSILQIPICTTNINDFWSWNFQKSGRFTVHSAYRIIIETKKRREDWLEERAGSSNTSDAEKSWDTMEGYCTGEVENNVFVEACPTLSPNRGCCGNTEM